MLTSETSWERQRMDGELEYWTPATIENAALALQDAGFGVDLINERILNSRISNYRALVIADDQRAVLPRTVESLEAFVAGGGTLLVMGSGLVDCPGKDAAVESLLGIRRTARTEGSNAVDLGGRTASFSSIWGIETSGAEVLAVYENGAIFLTRNEIGKGTAAYLSAADPIPYPDHEVVLARILEKLSVKPWMQVLSGDEDTHLVYAFRSKPGRLYLHMVNLTSHVDGQRIEPHSSNAIDPVARIPHLELNLEMPVRPKAVSVVPAHTGVEHTWSDGQLKLILTNLDYHAGVEIAL